MPNVEGTMGENGEIELLPGIKFKPTAVQLVNFYLPSKKFNKPLPAKVIHEIHVQQLYSLPPHLLVAQVVRATDDEWYFFVHDDDSYVRGEKKNEQTVGNGDGFWRVDDDGESPIIDTESFIDTVVGFKTRYNYFAGQVSNPEKTEWKLEKYRLPYNADEASKDQTKDWVIARIIKGDGYVYSD